MKVYINKYRYHWFSPLTIMEKFFFWRKGYEANPKDVPKFLSIFSKSLNKVLDIIHPKIDYVKIDEYDTWNMDVTLAIVILPMLKQLKATKHGWPQVDDEDVPEELRACNSKKPEGEFDMDENFGKRWDYVLDQMIWAFEQIQPDSNWEDQYHSGKMEWIEREAGVEELKEIGIQSDEKDPTWIIEEGPNSTAKFDHEGYEKHQAKITEGFRLFGKYYQSLWD
jgi:hypothetical protein